MKLWAKDIFLSFSISALSEQSLTRKNERIPKIRNIVVSMLAADNQQRNHFALMLTTKFGAQIDDIENSTAEKRWKNCTTKKDKWNIDGKVKFLCWNHSENSIFRFRKKHNQMKFYSLRLSQPLIWCGANIVHKSNSTDVARKHSRPALRCLIEYRW